MRFVTSGYLQRLFAEQDKQTILRRPNIRRFVLQYNVPYEQHKKAWLIDFDVFMKAIAPKKSPVQEGIPKVRRIENALKDYNSSHKQNATMDDVKACLKSGNVFYYSYRGRTIVNYDELEIKLETHFNQDGYLNFTKE